MTVTALYIVAGYLSGSVLSARLAAALLGRSEALASSDDGNPGAANAFHYGGFWCGVLALLGDLAKGILPVFLYIHFSQGLDRGPLALALVLAAPVVGHAFPLWYRFQGGKGIAVSFGVLMGLFPMWRPAVLLALIFIFFSVVLKITPHFYRTVVTYLVALVTFFFRCAPGVWGGFSLITGTVLLRLHLSKERRDRLAVKLLWMH